MLLDLAYKELVYGGHLLALGTSSIAATVAMAADRTPTWDLLLMAYLFTLGAYTVNRYSDFEEDRLSSPARTAHLESRRKALPALAALAFVVGYGLALTRNLIFFAALLAPLGLALAYSVASKGMKGAVGLARLKEGFLVKNLAISLGWSLIPILVGLYYLDLPLALLAFVPYIFMRLMVNTIFFDVRDLDADRKFGVRTFPSVLGVDASSRIMNTVDVVSAAYILALVGFKVDPLFVATLAVFTVYSLGYRYYSRGTTKHSDSLRDLAADGEYVLWGVLVTLGHI